MNETPSTPPPQEPQPPAPEIQQPAPNIKPWQATGIGSLIFIVTVPLCFIVPPLGLLGLAAAIGSLFFKGYRCIFIGYIGTFGLILLGLIIYCSNNPVDFK